MLPAWVRRHWRLSNPQILANEDPSPVNLNGINMFNLTEGGPTMAHPVYYSGIDLHKNSVVICTVDSDGNQVSEATLRNHPAAVAAYFAGLPGLHRAVVESTSGWYWLSDLFDAIDVDLTLAHAAHVKAISYAKVKTDRVDARTLAQLLRIGMIPEAHQVAPKLRGQRDLLRTRLRLVQRKTSCLNSIERLFEKYNVEAISDLPELYRQQARYHRDQATLLEVQIKQLEKTLRPHLRRDLDLYRLACLPGFGEIVAATVRLETGDVGRFPKDRQYCSYARLVPGAANSARRHRQLSGHKAGNKYLKLAYSHAAVRAIQHYPEVRAVYQKKRRKKHPKVARAYVAKELARIAYYILKHQKNFDGCFRGQPLKRQKTPTWPRPAGPGPHLEEKQGIPC